MDDPQSAAVASSSTAAASKLDSMSKDELTKLVKKYTVLQKQNKTKIEELTSKLTNFENDLKNVMLGISLKINSSEVSIAFLKWSALNSEYCGKTFDDDSLIFRCKVENPTPNNTYTLFTPEQLFEKFIKTIEP